MQKDISLKFKVEGVGEYTTNFKKMDQNKKANVLPCIFSGESLTAWSASSTSMTSEPSFLIYRL